MQLTIDYIGGKCPVQAEGTINGTEFYFRARGKRWQMWIGVFYAEEEWGEGPFAAGYMPEAEAERIIEQCAREYVEDNPVNTETA